MLVPATIALLTAVTAVASPIDNVKRSSVLSSSSGVIARKIHKCHMPPPPTVYFPLNFRWGIDQKISTDLVIPGTDKTMNVCFDQGSEDYWVLAPGSKINWGAERPGAPGPCNATASPVYQYSASPAATKPEDFYLFDAYGNFNKLVVGYKAFNDTMTFTSVSGQRSTVPKLRASLVEFVSVLEVDLTGHCGIPDDLLYDAGILGIAPYRNSSEDGTTNGPHVRQQLLEEGVIKAPVQSMWMDKPPAGVQDTYTGGAIFGGIDTSKFTGPLVKVPVMKEGYETGYYVAAPRLSYKGKQLATVAEVTRCFIDSGTRSDALPIGYYEERDAFLAATGIVVDEKDGETYWPSECENVPADVTVDLKFPGLRNGTSVDVKIPIKNYVRYDPGKKGLCRLNLYLGNDCTLAAPFASAAFFAADDERGEVAFAQGGISERGSAPDQRSIVLRIPH
ncbi:aspartic peptidase domain-containing protein [Xylariaceae sp. FL0594]|nr:aspartic peptidase domain-containing protein [Xylariaceae sp. FL0594]